MDRNFVIFELTNTSIDSETSSKQFCVQKLQHYYFSPLNSGKNYRTNYPSGPFFVLPKAGRFRDSGLCIKISNNTQRIDGLDLTISVDKKYKLFPIMMGFRGQVIHLGENLEIIQIVPKISQKFGFHCEK
jgi:hypothetical protein